jgi:hypothetical protein
MQGISIENQREENNQPARTDRPWSRLILNAKCGWKQNQIIAIDG